jgi:serine/threonine-protein kinase
VDQRSDIFSLGIVLFECLAGRMPFTDESPLGLMLEVVKAEIPDVRTLNAEVDPELERILAKMVAKDPADRYQSCQELVADLARHPLVAKGGPITLQTKMSTAAATMVGQKTPVSGQRPLPTTSPTPQPLPVSRPTTPAASQPVMGAHQPVLQPQTAKSSPMLPLAIAAILILGLAGGAWAFRDRIPVLQQFLGASATTAQTPTTAMQTPAPTPAPAVQTTPANMAPAQQTAVSEPPPPTDPRYAEATPSNASTAIPPTPAPQENPPAAPAQPPVASTASAPAPAPPVQVATAAEPPKVIAPARPHVPTIAILASGDDAISEPAEQAIESTLMHRGYRVVDQDSLPRVGRLIDGERPRFAEALALLQGHADAVVFVHARKVGAQEMNYYGQTSTLYTAQLNVRAYSVEGRRQLGPPWSEQVNFTSLNAGDKAKEAVEPMLERVSERLVDFRPKARRE